MKKHIQRLALALMGLLLFWYALNIFDAPLNAKVAEQLAYRPDVPANFLAGYKYRLGLSALANQDPLVVGDAIYNKIQEVIAKRDQGQIVDKFFMPKPAEQLRLRGSRRSCQPSLCSEQEWQKNSKEYKTSLEQNKILLARYQKLTSFGGQATPQRPDIEWGAYGLSDTSNLSRLQMLQRNIWLREKNYMRLIQDLAAERDYLVNSLNYPQTLIESVISVARLRDIRQFTQDAANRDRQFKKYLNKDFLAKMQVSLPTEKILNQTRWSEISTTNSILRRPTYEMALALSPFDGEAGQEPSASWYLRAIAKLMKPFLHTHRTLNEIDRRHELAINCALRNENCEAAEQTISQNASPSSGWLINPIGLRLLKFFSTSIVRVHKKIKTYADEVAQPLTL